MIHISGNIWEYLNSGYIGIPTNGYISRNGTGVLGRGLAKQALDRFPDLGYTFGQHLKTNGHCVGWMQVPPNGRLISIPVKPISLTIQSRNDYDRVLSRAKSHFEVGDVVPGYWCKADLGLIRHSLFELVVFIMKHNLEKVYIPALGCGNGGLDFNQDLCPLLMEMCLDDRIILVH
jgi:hypothetical protein